MFIKHVERKEESKGIKVENSITISHLLFVDDIMLFGHGL